MSRIDMRYTLSCIAGLLTTAVIFRVIGYVAALVGVRSEVELPYPMEVSFGRYVTDIVDNDLTAFGLASFAFAIAIGGIVGMAANRRKLNPFKSAGEAITAKAWFIFLLPFLFFAALAQLIFGTYASGSAVFLKDMVEYGVPGYIGWRCWKWWEVEHPKAIDSER
jgi:hypothetical protein